MIFPHSQLKDSLQDIFQSSAFRQQHNDFSSETIERVLRYGAPLGSLIEKHDSLSRCMGRLKELASSHRQGEKPLPSGTVVIANQLQDGCGRFDREWYAPQGGVWFAVAWADTLLPEFSRLLPLATGTACCQTIRQFGVNAAVKWVNDVHVDGKKMAGVLCETITGLDPDDRYHLIGVGINCNNTKFPPDLSENATSICLERGEKINLDSFTLQTLANLAWNFGLVHLAEEQFLAWERDGSKGNFINPVIDEWKVLSDTPGQKVVYGYDVVKQPLYTATVKEIDSFGGIVLQLENGSVITENSGEIIYT